MSQADTVESGIEPPPAVGFRLLALDALSGRPAARGSAPALDDTYELWRYRHAPHALLVLRGYESGAVIAAAALVPRVAAGAVALDEARFEGAVQRLLALRVPGLTPASGAGLLSDLELLDGVVAFEALGRGLWSLAREEATDRPIGLYGEPSADTLDELDTWRLVEGGADDLADGEAETDFEYLAARLLEAPERLQWTGARERTRAERYEVLVHSAEPDLTVLLYFPPDALPPEVAVFLPNLDDDARHEELLTDVETLLTERALAGPAPKPLPPQGRFRRLGPARALDQVDFACEALENGEGCAHAYGVEHAGFERWV